VIAFAGAAGLAWWITRQVQAATAPAEVEQEASPWNIDNLQEETVNLLQQAQEPAPEEAASRNLAAFLLTIRQAEGTAGPDGYRTMFGHRLFADFNDHPRQPMQFTDASGRRLWSSAAGAYQFMAISPIPSGGSTRVDTWDRLQRKLGLPDFSPESQDRAAVELLDEAGALADVRAGRFAAAVAKARRTWASLPGAGYGQPERQLAWLQDKFTDAGGVVA
jgi:muramidase (phage lysozyme)